MVFMFRYQFSALSVFIPPLPFLLENKTSRKPTMPRSCKNNIAILKRKLLISED